MMEKTGQWTRVILLTPPPAEGGGLTASLRAEFEQRDWFAIEQNDPYLAFTELCLRDKAQAARSSWGLQRMEQLALVVTHSQHWSALRELAAAVRKYVPVSTMWVADQVGVQRFDDPPSEPLSPFDFINAGVSAPGTPSDAAAGEPELSTTTPIAPLVNGRTNHAGFNDPIDASQRITREEIDMLLQMDPGEGQGRSA